jgi:hypothetical protein
MPSRPPKFGFKPRQPRALVFQDCAASHQSLADLDHILETLAGASSNCFGVGGKRWIGWDHTGLAALRARTLFRRFSHHTLLPGSSPLPRRRAFSRETSIRNGCAARADFWKSRPDLDA